MKNSACLGSNLRALPTGFLALKVLSASASRSQRIFHHRTSGFEDFTDKVVEREMAAEAVRIWCRWFVDAYNAIRARQSRSDYQESQVTCCFQTCRANANQEIGPSSYLRGRTTECSQANGKADETANVCCCCRHASHSALVVVLPRHCPSLPVLDILPPRWQGIETNRGAHSSTVRCMIYNVWWYA